MLQSFLPFFYDYILPVLIIAGLSALLLVVLLVIIAFLLLMDRKVWAAVQMRRGPNVVGPFGLLQSFADLLKFALKEPLIPAGADKGVFLLAPLATATFALAAWAVIPVNEGWWGKWVIADLNVGILYVLAISSLGVYGIIMGGWASNSKYPFMGALRSAAQMVSYEVSIGFVIICVLLCAGSLNLTDVVNAQKAGLGAKAGLPGSFLDWYWLPLFPMFVVFFISALAETNRPPFDLVEAESELVAGFMVEYGSTPYLLFMLGEYVAIVGMCAMTTILFLGGWLPPVNVAPFTWVPGPIWFLLKLTSVFFMFAMVKAMVPRYRYDQLMRLGWKVFLPLSLVMVVVTAAVLQFGGGATAVASGPASRADTVSIFDSVCLASLPKFPNGTDAFASSGYVGPTDDPNVKSSKAGGFAGLGQADVAGAGVKFNGCLVYGVGLEAQGFATAVDALLQKRFSKVKRLPNNGNDIYWGIGDFAPANGFLVFVAPKSEGKYAGHTLLMVSSPSRN